MTAVRPPARFGRLEIQADQVVSFAEKPQMSEGWINGAFFVLEPGIFDYIADDETQFEKEPLERLAKEGQLMAYRHEGFWQCMDTSVTRCGWKSCGKPAEPPGSSGGEADARSRHRP